MDFPRNLCCLCLSNEHKLVSQRNLDPSILDIFGYILPEYAYKISEASSICDSCLNTLGNTSTFRQKCLESIKTYTKDVDEPSNYLSSEITDIPNNQRCEISKDIQNATKIKAEICLDEEIKSETSVIDCSNSGTGNNEQTLGKFEMVEVQVKKEINEEFIIEEKLEHSNLFENEISNNSEFHNIKNAKKEDGHIPSNESNEIDSQSLQSDTEDRPYQCGVCQKTFKWSSHMILHQSVHSSKKPYTCEICQKSFKIESRMRKHQFIHTGQRPFSCEVCQKSFKVLYDMRRHQLIHTGQKTNTCKICHKSFRDSSYLKKHNLIHTGEKPYSCEVCQKPFRMLSSLKQHKIIHISVISYTCEICHKSVGSISNFRRHKHSHNKSKKSYACEFCNKSFTASFTLKTHRRTHTGERPYTCEICHKSFTQSSSLKVHSRIHTGKKPYHKTSHSS